jgi:hypothetical protein
VHTIHGFQQRSTCSFAALPSSLCRSFADCLIFKARGFHQDLHMRAITQVAFGQASTALRVSFNEFVRFRIIPS